MRIALLIFFACVAVIGSWHGFPLVDVFADETYFVYAPLLALKTGYLLPQHLPYGTFTYLLLLPLQACAMIIAWLVATVQSVPLESLLFQNPFIGYIAPRALNVALYFLMVVIIVRSLRVGKQDEKSYARPLLLIVLLAAPLLIVAHSGKMWMTSLFLAFAAGMSLPVSPLLAVLFGGLAFANFPIMATFWIATVLYACWLRRSDRRALVAIIAVAGVVPLVIMLLNPTGIFLQILDILQNFAGILPKENVMPDATVAPLQWWFPIVSLGNLLKRCLIAAPFAVLAIPLMWRSRIKNPVRFWYAVTGAVLYLLMLSVALNPSVSGIGSIRYVSPLLIMLLLCITSLEIPRTGMRTALFAALGVLSLYTGLVFIINLAMPTTENRAYTLLKNDSAYKDAVIFSSVQEISFPYTVEAAELTKKWLPGACSTRCEYTLAHPELAPTSPTYLLVHYAEVQDQIAASLRNRTLVYVSAGADDALRVGVENRAGEYFSLAAWGPFGFGKTIHITVNGVTRSIP